MRNAHHWYGVADAGHRYAGSPVPPDAPGSGSPEDADLPARAARHHGRDGRQRAVAAAVVAVAAAVWLLQPQALVPIAGFAALALLSLRFTPLGDGELDRRP